MLKDLLNLQKKCPWIEVGKGKPDTEYYQILNINRTFILESLKKSAIVKRIMLEMLVNFV